MNNSTFISKYKPYFIHDFSIDEKLKSMIRTLKEIDDMNLLIVGNSGSGKSSMLYALIRDYYELSKTQSFPENNILFINNLKEQGISYYRTEMKTFCQSHSSIYGKKKMIVVDDIDMISEQCQQVFRNYIDKYKNNILFVSACSNIQKVIESIQSRIHILRTHKPNKENLKNIIQTITMNENLKISDAVQEYIIEFSNGSVREIINYLEKIYILNDKESTELTLDHCKKICSTISFHKFEEYIHFLKEKKLVEAIYCLYEIHDYGYSVIDILDYFFTFIKNTRVLSEDEKYKTIPVLCKYITAFHIIHEDIIELSLMSKDILIILS